VVIQLVLVNALRDSRRYLQVYPLETSKSLKKPEDQDDAKQLIQAIQKNKDGP
jgi:hypothetical protein